MKLLPAPGGVLHSIRLSEACWQSEDRSQNLAFLSSPINETYACTWGNVAPGSMAVAISAAEPGPKEVPDSAMLRTAPLPDVGWVCCWLVALTPVTTGAA